MKREDYVAIPGVFSQKFRASYYDTLKSYFFCAIFKKTIALGILSPFWFQEKGYLKIFLALGPLKSWIESRRLEKRNHDEYLTRMTLFD